jgi:hypothetical protein
MVVIKKCGRVRLIRFFAGERIGGIVDGIGIDKLLSAWQWYTTVTTAIYAHQCYLRAYPILDREVWGYLHACISPAP